VHRIWFNGEGYPDVDAMPPAVRRQYEAALRRKDEADLEHTSEVVRMGVWGDEEDGTIEVHTSQEIIINGKKYSDFTELPPAERELVRRMMGDVPDLMERLPLMEDIFDDGGFTKELRTRASRFGEGETDSEGEEFVLRTSRREIHPAHRDLRQAGPSLSSGWLVAFVLALVLLLVLVFGG
jgi:hypothetical protein